MSFGNSTGLQLQTTSLLENDSERKCDGSSASQKDKLSKPQSYV